MDGDRPTEVDGKLVNLLNLPTRSHIVRLLLPRLLDPAQCPLLEGPRSKLTKGRVFVQPVLPKAGHCAGQKAREE